VEQLVARWAHNPKVVGSSPAPATLSHRKRWLFCYLQFAMFYTYILYSERCDKYYIGFTHNLDGRLVAHNHPKNKGYTKRCQPWKVVFYKTFEAKKEAMEYELHLKSLKSKYELLKILQANKV
jgi:putative endonuclease